ncbi:MAG: CHASE2 domain-containing protein [Planctomycetota bacterium]
MKADDHSATSYLEHRPLLTPLQIRLLGVGGPFLAALLGVGLTTTQPVQRLENVTIDWRFRARGPLRVRPEIVIVAISEETRRTLKQADRRFELREHLPDAINHLADAGAAVIGLDFWLEDLIDPATDQRLAEAVAQANVLLAVTHQAGWAKRAPPLFLESAPPEGSITVYPDSDGVLRRLPPGLCLAILDDDGTLQQNIPHFPIIAAWFGILERDAEATIACEDLGMRLGGRTIPGRALIDYASVQPEAWTTLTFEDVVRNRFDRARVEGAIVLIGGVRTIEDSFPVPLSEKSVPGLYYHANVIAQILDQRWFRASLTESPAGLWVVAGLALAAGLFSWNQRAWWRHRLSTLWLVLYLGVGIVVFLGGWTYVSFALFDAHILVPVAAPVTAMGLALGTGLAAQWIILSANLRRLAERARRIETMLGQSVSRAVLEAIQADPHAIERTQVREVSVLFCDLRGFTATAGELAPEQVAALLNEYFNHITSAIFEHHGFIDKFVGDEVMAVFSVPLAQPDHPVRAVRTAVAIKRRLAELNRQRTGRGEKPLTCGIGIHTGVAAAGHIGSRERCNYTVVGHTINLGARIQGFTTGGEVLISKAVHACLPDDYPVTFWKQVEIRGCTGLYGLYRIDEDQAPAG